MRAVRRVVTLTLLVPPAIGGCEGGEIDSTTFVVRDSAGIEIVESGAPALSGSMAWSIEPSPVLEIGSVDGDAPYVFTRVWDATRLPDGRIVVVDETALEVRTFDADGRHVTTFGRPGDGPAEFFAPPYVAATPEGVLTVWDGGHMRLSTFTPEGELVDQVTLRDQLSELGVLPVRNLPVWEVDADGTLLSTGPVRPRRAEGLRDREIRIALVADRGASSHDLGLAPGGQSFVVNLERVSIGIGNPFAAQTAAGLAPAGLVAIGSDGRWEMRLVRPDAAVARILRAAIPRVPVTDELVASGLDRARYMADNSPLSLAQAEDAYAQIPFPDSVPPIASIMRARETLWVGRRTGWWYDVGDYDVFDADGRWITTVAMPPEISAIHELGEDYLLAHVIDELDVPHLRMYRIDKP